MPVHSARAFVPLVLTWLGYALLWIFALRCLSWVGINSLLVTAITTWAMSIWAIVGHSCVGQHSLLVTGHGHNYIGHT